MRLLFCSLLGVGLAACTPPPQGVLTHDHVTARLVAVPLAQAPDVLQRAVGSLPHLALATLPDGRLQIADTRRGRDRRAIVRLTAESDTTSRLWVHTITRSAGDIDAGDQSFILGTALHDVGVATAVVPLTSPDGCGYEPRWVGPGVPERESPPAPRDEVEPVLIGGMSGLSAQIQYAESARRAGLIGSPMVTFIVDESGGVSCEALVVGAAPALSDEALRVVRAARFTPGKIGGRPVKVRYTIPLRFQLQ